MRRFKWSTERRPAGRPARGSTRRPRRAVLDHRRRARDPRRQLRDCSAALARLQAIPDSGGGGGVGGWRQAATLAVDFCPVRREMVTSRRSLGSGSRSVRAGDLNSAASSRG